MFDNILSHDFTLRSCTLRLHANGVISGGCARIAKMASEADSVPLSFQNERQRRASIRKLGIMAKSMESNSAELKMALCYLLGKFLLYSIVKSFTYDILQLCSS